MRAVQEGTFWCNSYQMVGYVKKSDTFDGDFNGD